MVQLSAHPYNKKMHKSLKMSCYTSYFCFTQEPCLLLKDMFPDYDFDANHYKAALESCDGDLNKAAAKLGGWSEEGKDSVITVIWASEKEIRFLL